MCSLSCRAACLPLTGQFMPLIHTSMYSNRESNSRQPAIPINSVMVNETLAPIFPITLLRDLWLINHTGAVQRWCFIKRAKPHMLIKALQPTPCMSSCSVYLVNKAPLIRSNHNLWPYFTFQQGKQPQSPPHSSVILFFSSSVQSSLPLPQLKHVNFKKLC